MKQTPETINSPNEHIKDEKEGQSWSNPGDFPPFAPDANKAQVSSLPTRREKRTRTERMQRFTELATKKTIPGSEKLQGEARLNEILDQVTPEGALMFLQHINSQLRNNRPAKGSKVIGQDDPNQRMIVGGGHETYGAVGEAALIAPERELQQELLAEYLDAIKKAEGRDKKAALAFYAINNLHLFGDGNGRTSRVIYQMIKNGDISTMSDDYTEHENQRTSTEGKGRGSFLKINQLPSPEQINLMANEFLREELCDTGSLDSQLRDKQIYLRSYDNDDQSGLVKIAMRKSNRAQLSPEEQTSLSFALSDGNAAGRTTLSGLTIISILDQKGKTDEIVAGLGSQRQLGIDINFDDFEPTIEQRNSVKHVFADWTINDYQKTIETYRALKKRQNEMIMRFFTEDLEFDDGSSVSDWACGHSAQT